MGSASIILLILCGLIFTGGGILLSSLLSKKTTNPQKLLPYECGINTSGVTWIQFNVGYYLFALIFLIFDVELIFMYPWAVVVRETGFTALIEIVIFLSVLALGFAYAWKEKALKWD